MRIADINANILDRQNIESNDTARVHSSKVQMFTRQLSKLSQDAHKSYIEGMMQDVCNQGEKLSKKADVKEFIKYRELVGSLMHEVVSNAYEFSKKNTMDTRGRHRIYAVVNKVNTKLDDMAKEFLKDQCDNLKILKGVDDIRGLLIDLLV